MDSARRDDPQDDPQDDPDLPDDQRWTPLAAELRRLRSDAGEPSFQTIATRVRDRRLAAGATPAGARVARSTVYDCFRDGRKRMNLPLVAEIALALGVPEAGVEEWVAAARAPSGGPPAAVPGPAPAPAPTDTDEDTGTETVVVRPPARGPDARAASALVAACVALNLAGLWFVAATDLPFFLDMVGTAIAAIALGPWRGALVGATSSVVGLGLTAPEELPFLLVNVAGALLWGYGVRTRGMGRTLPRFLALNAAVAVVSTSLAVPILLLVAGAEPRGPQDQLTVTLAAGLGGWVAASVASNLLASLVDKVVAGFVALVAVSALPTSMRRGCGLVLADPDLGDGTGTGPLSRAPGRPGAVP